MQYSGNSLDRFRALDPNKKPAIGWNARHELVAHAHMKVGANLDAIACGALHPALPGLRPQSDALDAHISQVVTDPRPVD